MNIEELRELCLSFPHVTEDIKWGNNLVFSVYEKMFCLADLEPPLRVAFKVPEDQFLELTASPDIIQASHFARMKWVTVVNENRFNRKEWEHYLRQSYDLVVEKLPKKTREGLI
jgi:predicted DNA-binding protein (MmcQ/YjbR family)